MDKGLSSGAVGSKPRVVRVFISSTFRDMQAERDILVKKVFPELRERCKERRIDFLGVDLRWGITEAQAERGETLPVCLEEIENCRPYFIGLLGERYGWVPDHIDPELIEMYPWLDEHRDQSITALEILHGVLKNHDMANHAFFYYRDPAYLEKVSADLREDLESEGSESKKKLEALKERIRKSDVPVRENYPNPDALAGYVLDDLWTVIASQYPPVEEPDPLDREFADHEAFASNRLRIYIERAETLEKLDEHIKGTDPPLVLLGESGSGKSALIANWAKKYREKNPSDFLLAHFIGSTPESSDYTRILYRVMGELKRRYDLPGEIPTKSAQLCAEFPNWVSMASAKEGFMLILDGLNQLSERDNAPELGWLPEYFPPNVRVILSSLPGPSLEALKRRGYPMFRVEPLTKDERKSLINDYLWQYRKRLSKERVNRIVGSTQSENPLYLRVLLDELKVFGIYEKLDERISHYFEAEGIDNLFQKVLCRFEEDYENERPGLVGETMSCFWASRRGLSEMELLELLNVPHAVWSPFYLAIKDFLVTRSGLFGFFHDYLRQAVKERYLSREEDRKAFHRRLAGYFKSSEEEERKVVEFPWHLWQGENSTGLEGALSNLELSNAIWEDNQFDLYTYWAFLEGEGFKKERTYIRVVQDPVNHQAHLFWISELFYRTGVMGDSLKIREAWCDICRESGDRGNLGACLGNQALIQQAWGNLEEAMGLHKEEERICKELGNPSGLVYSFWGQALLWQEGYRKPEHALPSAEEALRLFKDVGMKQQAQAVEKLIDKIQIVSIPTAHPIADPKQASQLDMEYQEELHRWKALPWLKRIRTKKPAPPPGI